MEGGDLGRCAPERSRPHSVPASTQRTVAARGRAYLPRVTKGRWGEAGMPRVAKGGVVRRECHVSTRSGQIQKEAHLGARLLLEAQAVGGRLLVLDREAHLGEALR